MLHEYVSLNHAEVIPKNKIVKLPNKIFHLPIHEVVKESSTTMKLCIIFDASAKYRSGVY